MILKASEIINGDRGVEGIWIWDPNGFQGISIWKALPTRLAIHLLQQGKHLSVTLQSRMF